MPRALVVGASETAARLHLPVLAQLRNAGRLDLVDICDLRVACARAARQRFGFARDGGDAAAAIARADIDIVYLFGSARMHHALGLAALDAGKHLFVEKPIAPRHVDAAALADAAQARDLIAVGGHNRRFLAAFDRIRAEAGHAGWNFAEAVFHKPETGRPPPFGAASWLSGNGIHALDALVFMMGGLPEWLNAVASGSRPAPSVFAATMRWPNGAQGVLLSNNEAGTRHEGYAFHAPGESWRVSDRGLTVARGDTQSHVDVPFAGDGFVAEHEAFLDAVATGAPPPHAIAALAPSLFLAELIEAGHYGPVRLPAARSPAQRRTTAPSPTILLGDVERHRDALGAMPAHWRLIPIETFRRSAVSRPDITAAILGPRAVLSPEALDRLPNLAVVGVIGLSLRHHDPQRLLDRGITLVNASSAYAESVAEFALGLAILGRRRVFEAHHVMRRGGWGATIPESGWRGAMLRVARSVRPLATWLGIERYLAHAWRSRASLAAFSASRPSPSLELAGALVGLIGWGANAEAFTRRLVAAGADVIVHSDHASPDDIRGAGAAPAPLASVLAADIVSLHRGLSPATRHRLGATELARLRPGAVLINVARGALIEPGALVARLARGDLIACLDTFEDEPLPRRHPLRGMRNVFLTPHIAGGSPAMYAVAARQVIDKVAALLDGRTIAPITAERLATMT